MFIEFFGGLITGNVMFPERYEVMDDMTDLWFRNSGEFECLPGKKRRRLMNGEGMHRVELFVYLICFFFFDFLFN